jgi:hypothetical protein
MNTEDIIRMAREAGFNASNGFSLLIVRHSNGSWVDVQEELTRFAALVEAAAKIEMLEAGNDKWLEEARRQEREACAKVCEELGSATNGIYERNHECAAAIRAGSKT